MAALPDLPSGLPSRGAGSIESRIGKSGTIIKFIGVGLLSSVLVFKECNCFHSNESIVSKEETEIEEAKEFIKEGTQELVKEGFDKFTQPNDTSRKMDYPIITNPDFSYQLTIDESNENTISSNEEACKFVNGLWVAIIKGKDVEPIAERWTFRCSGDDKIEVTFGGPSTLFCSNRCYIQGNIYITNIYFKYNDVRGYDYDIRLNLRDGKLVGSGSRTWNSDNKTYNYTIELRNKFNH